MSFTCGFFNAVNHDRTYDAKQMSSIFDGIINDGIFMNIGDALMVKATTKDGNSVPMNVYVGSGRAWFNSTWSLNDSVLPLVIDDAELVLDRIDTIVLEINADDSVRENSIKVIKGTPATEPKRAELENSEYVHQYALASVYVKAESTEITQSEITNYVGTEETPYITGILKTINASNLLAQWDDEFGDWFATLKDVLDGDAAGNLYNLITNLQNQVETIENGRIYTATLSAGSTTVTIQNAKIKRNMAYSFYSEVYGLDPTEVTIENGSATLTFEAQSEDITVGIRVDSLERDDAYTGTLYAGDTSVTINGSAITTDSFLSYFTSIYGVNPLTISVKGGSVTMTFEAQTTDMKVGVIIDG